MSRRVCDVALKQSSSAAAFKHVLVAQSVCVCAELSRYKQHDLAVLQKYERADDNSYDKEDGVCVC